MPHMPSSAWSAVTGTWPQRTHGGGQCQALGQAWGVQMEVAWSLSLGSSHLVTEVLSLSTCHVAAMDISARPRFCVWPTLCSFSEIPAQLVWHKPHLPDLIALGSDWVLLPARVLLGHLTPNLHDP